MITVSESRQNNVFIITIQGRLDQSGAPMVEKSCTNLIQDGAKTMLVDMAGVKYISSAGLRTLLVVAKMMRASQGRFMLCSLSTMVREVMEISGFDKVLTWAKDRESGLASLND